jgi:hypothetical protein
MPTTRSLATERDVCILNSLRLIKKKAKADLHAQIRKARARRDDPGGDAGDNDEEYGETSDRVYVGRMNT